MSRKNEAAYESCVKMMHELVELWEKVRPDEELVIMALPKRDIVARRVRLKEISRMILREKWDEGE